MRESDKQKKNTFSQYYVNMELEHTFVMGERKNTQFLYIFLEKQLYTFNANGVAGKIYRCANRKCKSRRIYKESEKKCIKSSSAHEHNHADDCESRYKNLLALQDMKKNASDLCSIASGSRMTKSRDIYKQAILK